MDEQSLLMRVDDLTIEQRTAVRENYRRLIATAQDAATSDDSDMDSITRGINASTRLFQDGDVLLPTEGAYDAETLKQFSELFRQKVLNQKNSVLQFDSNEYASQFIRYVKQLGDRGRNARDGPTNVQWADMGAAVSTYLKRTPAFHFLYGSFGTEAAATQQQPTQATQRRRQRRTDLVNENVPVTQPRTVTRAEDLTESEETTRMVDQVSRALLAMYDQNGHQPISYFEFVLDPESFVQSVETMFYVSFLIKDGKVGIELDAAGLPVLRIIEQTENEDGPSPARGETAISYQSVLTMNKDLWKKLVDAYQIRECILKKFMR